MAHNNYNILKHSSTNKLKKVVQSRMDSTRVNNESNSNLGLQSWQHCVDSSVQKGVTVLAVFSINNLLVCVGSRKTIKRTKNDWIECDLHTQQKKKRETNRKNNNNSTINKVEVRVFLWTITVWVGDVRSKWIKKKQDRHLCRCRWNAFGTNVSR